MEIRRAPAPVRPAISSPAPISGRAHDRHIRQALTMSHSGAEQLSLSGAEAPSRPDRVHEPPAALAVPLRPHARRSTERSRRSGAAHLADRLLASGARSLNAEELLSLLLGDRVHESVARQLARAFRLDDGAMSLRRLARAGPRELANLSGIGPARAARLLAAVDLARRLDEEEHPLRERVGTPREVYNRMRFRLRDLPHEEFHVLLLNTQNQVLRDLQVSRGTLDAALVHPREVFRTAIAEAAASIIVVHNHPSGDPTPSAEDRAVTRELRSAGETVGIEVLDHVIIGEGRYVSFVEAGLWS